MWNFTQVYIFKLTLFSTQLFRKGMWSPKSPKQKQPIESVGGDPSSFKPISPTLRRCCVEIFDDSGQTKDRRLSESSKDSSIPSDTSLDSEDSCISVIFVPKPGDPDNNRSISDRSTSNSSGSSESPKSPGTF